MNAHAEEKIKEIESKKEKPLTDEEKQAVIDYFDQFENEEMYCPICKTRLVTAGWFIYDDVCGESESVKYICPKEGCDLHTHGSFWNYYGDFFSGNLPWKLCRLLFPEDQYAALNTCAKESEVCICGKGLKRKIYLHPAFAFWIMQPYIEFKYKGDKMGNVLGRKWKLGFLKWDKQSKRYCTVYTSGTHMLIWTFKRFLRAYSDFYKTKTPYACKELLERYEKRSWDKRWWALLSWWYFDNFYNGTKYDAEDYMKLWKRIDYRDVKLITKELSLNQLPLIDFLETSSDEVIKKYTEIAKILREHGRKDD